MATEPTRADTVPPIAVGAGSGAHTVIATGGGYRAVITRDDVVIWSCAHVHFTEHSARSCPAAAQYLALAT